MAKRTLRTKLCDMLGIECPILCAGMGPTLIGDKKFMTQHTSRESRGVKDGA